MISPGFPILVLEKGIWYYIQVLVLCISILYSITVLIIKTEKIPAAVTGIKVLFLLIGVSVPVITMMLYMLGVGPVYLDLTPFSYFIMSNSITVGLFRYDMWFLIQLPMR